MDPQQRRLAGAVRDACVRALLDAYEDAAIRGVCEAGRWEHALAVLRRAEPRELLRAAEEAELPER